jgi:hypothetical protein
MSTGTHKFRRTEVVRAIKAAEIAGLKVAGVEIEPSGKIVIAISPSDAPSDDKTNEWNEWAVTDDTN